MNEIPETPTVTNPVSLFTLEAAGNIPEFCVEIEKKLSHLCILSGKPVTDVIESVTETVNTLASAFPHEPKHTVVCNIMDSMIRQAAQTGQLPGEIRKVIYNSEIAQNKESQRNFTKAARGIGMAFKKADAALLLNSDPISHSPSGISSSSPTSGMRTRTRYRSDQNAENGPIRNKATRVGRNQPCPCESGKKYKACCGAKETSN